MPAVTSGKVLVTGANGFVAIWVVKSLLQAGFAVRGTVRSESKAAYLRSYFQSSGNKFETVIVPDITKDDAFDEAVKDVDAIAHTASPFHMKATHPDEMILPAVSGTLSVLKAAQAHGANVKRIIVLSSVAALYRSSPQPIVVDETSWNDESVAEVKEKGSNSTPDVIYRASKTLAERAAWEWIEANKETVGFDLTVLNPSFVFGPNIQDVDKLENLGQSMQFWYHVVVKVAMGNDFLANMGACYVDVRDVAEAHTLAFKTPAAGGNRFALSGKAYKWQDFVSVAHRLSDKIPAGNTSYDPSKAVHMIEWDNRKSIATLGMKYRSIEEITRDCLEDFKARGWL